MNAFIVGQYSSFVDALISKLNKEGHRVYILTGDSQNTPKHKYVFEQYSFAYNSESIKYMLEGTKADIVIYTGAYDRNFTWNDPKQDAMMYISGLTNTLMCCNMLGIKRFVYLSSSEVYGGSYAGPITEDTIAEPNELKAMSVFQGETICSSYRDSTIVEPVIVRIDNMYGKPATAAQADDKCTSLCLEAIKTGVIRADTDERFSCIYEADVVEGLYKLINAGATKYSLYHLSSSITTDSVEISGLLNIASGGSIDVRKVSVANPRAVTLSGERFSEEFDFKAYNALEKTLPKVLEAMWKEKDVLLVEEQPGTQFKASRRGKAKKAWHAAIPYLENVVFAAIVVLLSALLGESDYFARLDFYILYTVIFAAIFGRRQGIMSAVLSVVGFFVLGMMTKSGYELLVDYSVYLWIAQLFVLGMAVGYTRDQLSMIEDDKNEEIAYLSAQVSDVLSINSSNNRIKNVLHNQLITQNDSVGRIYEMVSTLESMETSEVLFSAADLLSRLMGTNHVAIYSIVNEDYCRMVSSTSKESRKLGNSVKYSENESLMHTIRNRGVYVNRSMDEGNPSMASVLRSDDKPEFFLVLWGLPFERMTNHQENLLTVIGALIYNAVRRANQFIEAIKQERFIEGSKIMQASTFGEMVRINTKAMEQGYTDCVVMKLNKGRMTTKECASIVNTRIRVLDYIGIGMDDELYMLLTNTDRSGADYVINRLLKEGITCSILEG